MKKSQVLDHYGGVTKTATALQLSKGTVSLWPEDLPIKLQCFIEVATNGALMADRSSFDSHAAGAQA
jgi:hypothetical protein